MWMYMYVVQQVKNTVNSAKAKFPKVEEVHKSLSMYFLLFLTQHK